MKIGEMSTLIQGCSGEYQLDVREIYKGTYQVTVTERPTLNDIEEWQFWTIQRLEQCPTRFQWTVVEKDLFALLSKIWDRIITCKGFYG